MRLTAPVPRPQNQSDMKLPPLLRQRWLLIPLILVIIAGIVFWWLPARAAPAPASATATVSQGTLTTTVSGSGAVAAARQVDLPFQQDGQVTSVAVKVGDQVQAGQTLAQIDTGDLQLQLQQVQANLQTAQAKLAQAKGGDATAQDLAQAQAGVDSAKAQLQKARTNGQTTLVQLAADGTVRKQVDGQLIDIKPGEQIVALGTQNGNTFQASSIQIGGGQARSSAQSH
jgi:multidrug efflux pump subunit AcrA (membrane-fusion protein)